MTKSDSDEDCLMDVDAIASVLAANRASNNDPKGKETLKVITSARKPLKDMFIDKKFPLLYGQDQGLYDTFMDYGSNWYNVLYVLDESKLKQSVADYSHHVKPIEYVNPADFKIETADTNISNRNTDMEPIHLVVEKGPNRIPVDLHPADALPLYPHLKRNAFAINVGGYVTSSQWLPSESDSQLFLALSAIKSTPEGLSKVINHRDISMFNSKTGLQEVETFIQVWKFDLKVNILSLHEHIDTTAIGAGSNLSWLPTKDESSLGFLAGCFTDGRLHILKMSQTPNTVSKYESSLTYELKPDDNEIIPITSYVFKGSTTVIAGGLDGSIAEFILPNYGASTDKDPEYDITIPSFVLNVSESPIIGITISNPSPDIFYLFVQTADTEHLIIQYLDQKIRASRSGTSSLTESRYHHQLRVFIGLESADSIIVLPVKSPQEKVSSIVRSDSITGFAISEYIGHPFILFGNSIGELSMVNFSRKLLLKKRVTAKQLLYVLRLWKLSLEDTLVLNGDFGDLPSEKPTIKSSFSPPELSFSSMSWSESLEGSSLYAAASLSGLLLVERLDPNL